MSLVFSVVVDPKTLLRESGNSDVARMGIEPGACFILSASQPSPANIPSEYICIYGFVSASPVHVSVFLSVHVKSSCPCLQFAVSDGRGTAGLRVG